jgi:hypothetical protein
MKFLLIIALFITTKAFAVNICELAETANFFDTVEAKKIKPVKTSKNHKRFTFVEKQMIHLSVTQQDYLKGITKEESLEKFGDFYQGKIGDSAGEILYYELSGKQVALVHYYPGDNEYGAFFVMKNGSYKLMARIDDSFITCE